MMTVSFAVCKQIFCRLRNRTVCGFSQTPQPSYVLAALRVHTRALDVSEYAYTLMFFVPQSYQRNIITQNRSPSSNTRSR